MWWYDPDAAHREECKYKREFEYLATDSILAPLKESGTPEQYKLALECLEALRDAISGRIDAFHRSPLYGRHRCVHEAYQSMRLKLQAALELRPVPQLTPEPEPPPPEPPPPKPRSLRDVVTDFGRDSDEDNPEGQ